MKKRLVLRILDLRFYIFHREEPIEPPHVHCFKGEPHNPEAEAKVRIDGEAEVFWARGFNKQSLGEIEKITQGYIKTFSSQWRKIHGKKD
jgi:hypothetical protein